MQFFIYAYQNNGFYYGTSDRIFNDSNLIEVPTLPPDSNHKWDGSQWVQKTEAEINENVTESEPEEKVPSLPSSVTDNTIATFDGLSGDRISDSLTTIDDEGVVTVNSTSGDYAVVVNNSNASGEILKASVQDNTLVTINESGNYVGSLRLYSDRDKNNAGVVVTGDGRVRVGKTGGDSPDDNFEFFLDGNLNLNNGLFYLNGIPVTIDTFVAGTAQNGYHIAIRNNTPVWEKIKRQWCWTLAINNGNLSQAFLRRQNGTDTSRNPLIVFADCIMYAISVDCQPTESDDFSLEVYRNGSIYEAYTKGPGTDVFIYDRTYALTTKKKGAEDGMMFLSLITLNQVLREKSKPSTAKCNRSLYILFLSDISKEYCDHKLALVVGEF